MFSIGTALGISFRAIVVGACGIGIWWSCKLARADELFRLDTPEAVAEAIRLVPDQPQYYIRLAKLDGGRSSELLAKAIDLEPYNSLAMIELGLNREAGGSNVEAERLLLGAFEVDRTFLPRWSLANFYFRQGNMRAFWQWARASAQMPSNDLGPLFELCWRVTPDASAIASTVLTDNADTIRQYVQFLVAKNEVRTAASIAPRLIKVGQIDLDRPALLSLVDRLVQADDASSATGLWRRLADERWVLADSTLPNNARFARNPLPVAFDWRLPSNDGLHSWPGPSGLEVEFTGQQSEHSIVAEQVLPALPGEYRFHCQYRTREILPPTGLRWRVIDSGSGAVLAAAVDLTSDVPTEQTFDVKVPKPSLLRLLLEYQRTVGSRRISGMLSIQSTNLESLTLRNEPRTSDH